MALGVFMMLATVGAADPAAKPPAQKTAELQLVPLIPPPIVVFDEPPARNRNLAPWVIAGVGGASLLAGAIFGLTALAIQTGDHQTAGPNGLVQDSLTRGQASAANAMATASLPLLIAGVAALAGGLLWVGSPSHAAAEF